MKILLIHQFFLDDGDGGGSRFNELTRYWREKGHDVTVLAGTVHYATGKKLPEYKGHFATVKTLSNGARVVRCHVSEGYNKSFLGRLWAYFSFAFSSTVAGMRLPRPDVIVATSPPLFVSITGFIIGRVKKAPLVFEVRDLWPESAIETGVLTNRFIIKLSYFLEAFSYRHAVRINVLTPAFREVLTKQKGVAPEKISLIPNGADLGVFHPGIKDNWVRQKYSLEDKFVITYLGAHGLANNLITVVEAAHQLREYEEIHFLLVGDGMQRDFLQEKVSELGLGNVTLLPTQPKGLMPDFCNASDVCTAVLKKTEVFKTVYPNKVFDYMACAKPIILGIDGVARELVIEEARAGIFVQPEDPAAFAEAVLALWRNQELRQKLGENGRTFVVKEFSREALAKKYEALLVDLTSNQVRTSDAISA